MRGNVGGVEGEKRDGDERKEKSRELKEEDSEEQ